MTAKIKTICSECGDLVHDGITINEKVSHGFCDRCQAVIMAFIKGEDYDQEYAKNLKSINV